MSNKIYQPYVSKNHWESVWFILVKNADIQNTSVPQKTLNNLMRENICTELNVPRNTKLTWSGKHEHIRVYASPAAILKAILLNHAN